MHYTGIYMHISDERDARILFVQLSAFKYLKEWLCWPSQDSSFTCLIYFT